MSQSSVNTHNLVVQFGKHRGELWTRVPLSYLVWMVNASHDQRTIAQAELDRRGVNLDEYRDQIEISNHAIDRASLRLRKTWHEDRKPDEGLHTWLHRVAREALASLPERKEKIVFRGIKFVFGFGDLFTTLKSVMPARDRRDDV